MRIVGLLPEIRVEQLRGVGSVCGAHKKRVKAYNRGRFCSLKDALLAGARMGILIRIKIFKDFSAKFVKVADNEIVYTTVGFVPLKDALLTAPRVRILLGL